MMKLIPIFSLTFFLLACNNDAEKGKFSVTGTLKNAPDQKLYLEELYFSQKQPEVLDTAQLKNGKFSISAIANEEGLYRIRLGQTKSGFIFINDQDNISFNADLNSIVFGTSYFTSPANLLLYKFINAVDAQRTLLDAKAAQLAQLKNQQGKDSLYNVTSKEYEASTKAEQGYLIKFIDTASSPIVTLFALGYTSNIDPVLLEKSVAGLTKRFPNNQAVADVVKQYSQMLAEYKATPHEGTVAPELNMPDTSGKPFALSMLRGKYVLVDFWASWCGPCRGENPNIVNAYNTYKNKNFTVLSVSLDTDKQAWLNAIHKDNLSWYHISDLKQWNSAAPALYGFEELPYNVLVNPEGKIIATDLRGEALQHKLAALLQ